MNKYKLGKIIILLISLIVLIEFAVAVYIVNAVFGVKVALALTLAAVGVCLVGSRL